MKFKLKKILKLKAVAEKALPKYKKIKRKKKISHKLITIWRIISCGNKYNYICIFFFFHLNYFLFFCQIFKIISIFASFSSFISRRKKQQQQQQQQQKLVNSRANLSENNLKCKNKEEEEKKIR